MQKPSSALTFTDPSGKPHTQIEEEYAKRLDKIRKDSYKAGFKDGKNSVV